LNRLMAKTPKLGMKKDLIRSAYNEVLERVIREARITSTSRVLELGSGMVVFPTSSLRWRRYAFRKVSRSALIVSDSVVGMPCGKPL
jgi:hypothetical protein